MHLTMAALDFPSAPTVGQIYNAYQWDGEKWTSSTAGIPPVSGGGIPEAPVDGTFYGRHNETWEAGLPLANPGFTGTLSESGKPVLNHQGTGGVYTVLMNGDGNPSITIGGAAIPYNNYRNTNHIFQNADGSIQFFSASASGVSFNLSPTAPTPTAGDNTTKLATTAFVQTRFGSVTSFPEAPNDGATYGRKSLGWDKSLPLTGGTVTGPIIVRGVGNNLRLAANNYGVLHYNDDSAYYVLLTASGDALGSFNTLRPLSINLTNGVVGMGHGLNLGGPLNLTAAFSGQSASLTGSLTLNGTVTTAAKGNRFGSAAGVSSAAVASTDANVIFHDNGSGDWSGQGTDAAGNYWLRVGNAAGIAPAFFCNPLTQVVNFLRSPVAPTPAALDNSNKLATTAFVAGAVGGIVLPTVPGSAGWVTPGSAGVPSTGAASAKAAIDAIVASADDIWFFPGTYLIDAATTFPANKTYHFYRGAYLKLTAPLYIYGAVDAGFYKIFGTSAAGYDLASLGGSVSGIRSVRPDWWGTRRDAATDDAPPIKAAITCAEAHPTNGSYPTPLEMLFPAGPHYIKSTLAFSMLEQNPWRVRGVSGGSGSWDCTRIIASNAAFSGGAAIQFYGTGYTPAEIEFCDVFVSAETPFAGPPFGLQIVGTGTTVGGFKPARVHDVVLLDFTRAIQYENSRMFSFERVTCWNEHNPASGQPVAIGIWMTSDGGNHVGDTEFWQCQFTCGQSYNSTSHPYFDAQGRCVSINLSAANSHATGIKFHGCYFYFGDMPIELSATGANAHIDDIWFDSGCQAEGTNFSAICFTMNVTAPGAWILDVHIDHMYMVGWGYYKMINAAVSNGGLLHSLHITNNEMNNAMHEFVDVRNTTGDNQNCYAIHVIGNRLGSPSTSDGGGSNAAIYLQSVTQSVVNSNSMSGPGSRAYLAFFNVGCTWYTANGNNSGGLATTAVLGESGVGVGKNWNGNV